MSNMSKELSDFLKRILAAGGDALFSKFKEFEREIEACGGFKNACALAWNVEEKNLEVYSFKECVSWIKSHINRENAKGAFVYKSEEKNSLNKKYELNVCFFDNERKVLKGDDNSWLIVHCNSLDEEFVQCFGNKDVLVLQ